MTKLFTVTSKIKKAMRTQVGTLMQQAQEQINVQDVRAAWATCLNPARAMSEHMDQGFVAQMVNFASIGVLGICALQSRTQQEEHDLRKVAGETLSDLGALSIEELGARVAQTHTMLKNAELPVLGECQATPDFVLQRLIDRAHARTRHEFEVVANHTPETWRANMAHHISLDQGTADHIDARQTMAGHFFRAADTAIFGAQSAAMHHGIEMPEHCVL